MAGLGVSGASFNCQRVGFQAVLTPRYRALPVKLDTVGRDVCTRSGPDTIQHSFIIPSLSGSRIVTATKNPKKSGDKRAITVELSAESLAGVEVFQRLGSADRAALAALCHGRRYESQERVLSHKDPTEDIYFIISGRVRITIYSLGGKEITFRDQGAGEMF